jgi:hypothetical protein
VTTESPEPSPKYAELLSISAYWSASFSPVMSSAIVSRPLKNVVCIKFHVSVGPSRYY